MCERHHQYLYSAAAEYKTESMLSKMLTVIGLDSVGVGSHSKDHRVPKQEEEWVPYLLRWSFL